MASDNAPEYLIRRPEVADAEEIGALHVAVWRQAYVGMMSDDALARMDPANRATMWRRIAENADAREAEGNIARIAEQLPTGELAGFAIVGAARDDDAPLPLQLYAINVLRQHHGSGVADQLLAATLGDRPGYLWVVAGNQRAQAFYRRHGFAADGATQRDEELAADEIRMVRTLAQT